MATIIVALIVFSLMALAAYKTFKNKNKCSCGCSECNLKCHKNKE